MTDLAELEKSRDERIRYLKKDNFIGPNTEDGKITPNDLLTKLVLESVCTEDPRQNFNNWCRMMFNPTYFILKFFDLLLQVLQIPFQIVKIVIFDMTLDVFLRKDREKTPGTIFPYVENLHIPFVKNLEKQRKEELAKLDRFFDRQQLLRQKIVVCNKLIKILEDIEELKSNSKTDPHLQLLKHIESQPEIYDKLTHPNRNLLCPISQDLIERPVIADDGKTYEKTEIERWQKEKSTSPITRDNISNTFRIDDNYIKSLKDRYTEEISKQKDLEGQKEPPRKRKRKNSQVRPN